MPEFHKILKANPYRGAGGMFSTKAKAVSTKLIVPKQVSRPQKPVVSPDSKKEGKMKL